MRKGRRSRSVSVIHEKLESRSLLSAAYPTAAEQYMLELVNWARANPAAQASSFAIDLNEGLNPGTISSAPKQPLAFNPSLTAAAEGHSQWMQNSGQFSHDEGGSDPGAQMRSAGYAFSGSWGWGQNIAWRGTMPGTPPLTQTVNQENRDLFVDSSEAGRGHRVNMMDPNFKEAGVGITQGGFQGYNAVLSTEDFADQSGDSFLTGVAYNDSVSRYNFYEPGEGLGGVNVKAVRSDGATFSTTTWSSGGYTLQLPAGTYTVTGSGGGLGGTVSYGNVYIGSQNVNRDFTPAQATTTPPSVPTAPAPSPVPSSSTLATSTIQATHYNSIYLASSPYGVVGYTSNGAYVGYDNINFGSGVSRFQASVSLPYSNAGGQIVLHLDSPTGQTIGTLTTQGTGGWNNFQLQSTAVSDVTGVHNLYLDFVSAGGDVGNLASFSFQLATGSTTTPSGGTGQINATSYSGIYLAASPYGVVGYTRNGAWAAYSNLNFGSGVSTFQASVALPNSNAGGQMVLHLDSPTGQIIGTLTTQGTGGWNNYQIQSTAVTNVTGVHTLYIDFVSNNGDVGNLNWFKFI